MARCTGAAAAALAVGRELGPPQAKRLAHASGYDKSPGASFVGYVGVIF